MLRLSRHREIAGTAFGGTVSYVKSTAVECMSKLRKNVLRSSFRRVMKSTIEICLKLQYKC